MNTAVATGRDIDNQNIFDWLLQYRRYAVADFVLYAGN
jgi:hypothetical protein